MSKTDKALPQTDDISYDHVIKYTGLFGGVQGITMLVNMIRNKIVAILLGPSGLALINIYNNVTKLVNESTNFGISFSAVRNVSELFEKGNRSEIADFICTIRSWSLLTALFGMLVCCVLAPLISYWTFSNYDYTLTFCLLSPMVACLSITGGEIAILKGLRLLKSVAMISIFSTLATLLICTPIYFIWGINGIVGSLVVSNIIVLAIHLYFSTQNYPWHVALFSKKQLGKGQSMIQLGIAFILAGILGQGAEYIIRISILDFGTLADVGLYNSGYMMAITYSSMIFIAIEADYFPRLSATGDDKKRMNRTINQQIEVCVLLIAPWLIFFTLVMPYVIQLLYSNQFVEAAPMSICASFYMFFKAISLPIAYLPLAKGESKMYLLTELIYDVIIALVIPFSFKQYGLTGTGLALSITGLIDFIVIYSIYFHHYGFRLNTRPLRFYTLQFILLCFSIYAVMCCSPLWKWTIGTICLATAVYTSLHILKRETSLLKKLKEKIERKLHHNPLKRHE